MVVIGYSVHVYSTGIHNSRIVLQIWKMTPKPGWQKKSRIHSPKSKCPWCRHGSFVEENLSSDVRIMHHLTGPSLFMNFWLKRVYVLQRLIYGRVSKFPKLSLAIKETFFDDATQVQETVTRVIKAIPRNCKKNLLKLMIENGEKVY